MPRKKQSLADLMRMAEQYGCKRNPLFLSELNQYSIQTEIISGLAEKIAAGEDPEGLLVVELRKQCDSATRTASGLLTAIAALGTKPEPKADKLEAFLDD